MILIRDEISDRIIGGELIEDIESYFRVDVMNIGGAHNEN